MSLFDLTGFQRDLLYTIANLHEPSGQSIRERLEADIGEEIVHGRLYPNLATLVERGLVVEDERNNRTHHYRLSEAGVRALRERRAWEDRLDGTAVE
jgi:DNA-binding PadR family transcriptional regulator